MVCTEIQLSPALPKVGRELGVSGPGLRPPQLLAVGRREQFLLLLLDLSRDVLASLVKERERRRARSESRRTAREEETYVIE